MIEELASCPLFAGLDADALRIVGEEVALLGVAAGRVLFRQGDAADGLYIVLRGRVRSVAEDGRVLGEIGPGGFVGEMALLTGAPRSATVVAIRDSTLGRLGRGSFGRLVANCPSMAIEIARTVAARAQSNVSRKPGVEDFATVCLVSTTRDDAGQSFGRQFIAELSGVGRTVAIGPEALPSRRVGAPANNGTLPSDTAVAVEDFAARQTATEQRPPPMSAEDAAWFDTIESAHRYVVYLCHVDDPQWTALCVRRADLVLLAATPDWMRSSLHQHAPTVVSTLARTDLVLLHTDRVTPAAAGSALGLGKFRRVYHTRQSRSGDVGRLVRLLTGRATGLALSGGARRGAAHVGVLRALQETGTAIDLVAGTSAGAIVGAMVALELDWREALEHVHHLGRMRAWRDLGPPIVALLSGHSFSRHLQHVFGEAALEDCPVPLLPVCAAVESGETFVPDHGPLWLALRASASLPGVFPPVPWKRRLLMDGALVENLPIEVLGARCPQGRLVASDVGAPSLDTNVPDDLHSTSGWRLLAARLPIRRARSTHPGLVDLLISAACATSTRQMSHKLPTIDCYIAPSVEDHASLSRRRGHDIDVMAARGYEAALKALEGQR